MPNLGDMVVRIVGDNSELDSALTQSEKNLKKLMKSMTDLGKQMSLFVTAPLIAAGVAALKSAGQFQLYQASFETMLGDAARAKKLIDELQVLAAATPFKMEDLARGAQVLLQYGITVDKLLPTIRSLGDIAQGDSEKFNRLSLAFGQTQSTGRLMGQDLLQMINSGFNPLNIIAQETGRSMIDLKAAMEKGAISSDMVAHAFEVATSKGGMFFNGMEKASKTLPGLMSTLSDDIATLGRSFAMILMPTVMDAVKSLSSLAKSFTELDDGTKKAILAGAGVLAVAGPILVIIPKIVTAVRVMSTGFATSAGMIGLVVAAVALLIAGIVKLVAMSKAAKDEQELLNGAMKGTLGSVEEYNQALVILKQRQADAAKQTGDLALVGMKEAAKRRAQAKDDLLDFALRRNAIEQNKKAKIAADEAETAATKAKADAEMKAAQAKAIADADAAAALQEKLDGIKLLHKTIEDNSLTEQQLIDREIAKFREWGVADAEIMAYMKVTHANFYKKELTNLGDVSAAEIEGNTRRMEYEDAEKQRQNDALEAEIEGNTRRMENEAATQEELDRLRKEEHDKEVARQNFIMGLAISASKSIIDAVVTDLVTGKLTWKSFGEAALDAIGAIVSAVGDQLAASAAADIILAIAALASVIGAAAAPGYFASASIKAGGAMAAWAAGAALKAIELPAAAEGGIIPARPGGTAFLGGEAGQAEAIIPLNQLERMLSRGGGTGGGGLGDIHLVVRLDSKTFLDTIFPATRNRTVLIDGRAIVT